MHSSRVLARLLPGLVVFAVAGSAVASPSLVTKRGHFHSTQTSVEHDSPTAVLIEAARDIVAAELVAPTTHPSFGAPQHRALPSGERIVKLPQMHEGLPVLARGASVVFR